MPTETRKLVRYPDDGPLGGVCAGLADYLNVDPPIVRIVALVLAFTGPGIPAYVLAWIFVPSADGHVMAPWPHTGQRRGDRTSQIIGIAIIAIVVSVLWGDWWRPHPGWFVPVGLIALGAWLLLRNHDDDAVPPAPPAAGPPPPWQPTPPTTPFSVTPAPVPPAGVTEPTEPTTTPDPPTGGDDPMDSTLLTDDPTADAEATLTDTTAVGGEPPPPGGDEPTLPGWASPQPAHVRRPRRRRVLGPVVFGALLLWSGIAWLTGVSLQNGLAVGLCLVGAGFVVGAFIGGSRALILPALLVGAALIVVSTVDVPLGSGIGDRHWTIANLRDLEPSYDLGIGDATLDLRDLQLRAGDPVDVAMKVGIGHITVIAPEDAALVIDTKAGAGSTEVLGRDESGTSVETHRAVRGVSGAGTLRLHLKVGLGRVDVRQEPSDLTIGSSDAPAVTPSTTVPVTPTTPTTPTTPLSPAQP